MNIVSLRSFIFKIIWQNYYVLSISQGEILILTLIRKLGKCQKHILSQRCQQEVQDDLRLVLLSEVKESKWAILRVKRPQKKAQLLREQKMMHLTTQKDRKENEPLVNSFLKDTVLECTSIQILSDTVKQITIRPICDTFPILQYK